MPVNNKLAAYGQQPQQPASPGKMAPEFNIMSNEDYAAYNNKRKAAGLSYAGKYADQNASRTAYNNQVAGQPQQPQQPAQMPQPGIRANILDDVKNAGKKAVNYVQEKVIDPFKKGIKDPVGQFQKNTKRDVIDPINAAGNSIGDATRKVTDAAGITDASILENAKLKIDQDRAAAIAKYGTMVTDQANQFDPKAYGPGYFQNREYKPQISTSTAGMPGIYSPQTKAPTAPGVQPTPQLQNVGGQNLQLRDVSTGTGVNLSPQQSAISKEMAKYQGPLNLQEGYDPGLRQNYVDLATSGLDQQKQEAMARLKEEQMKAGNYGSSVGQKAMSDLENQFGQKIIDAGKEADLMQMEAARADRYSNLNADFTRGGMVSNMAGQGAGLEMQGQGYARDTANMQNQIELIRQDYARQGIQIDNDTAMRMALYGDGQNQQKFSNDMASANFNRENDMASKESEWKRYLAGQDIKAGQDAAINNASLFNINQGDATDQRNYGMYQDTLRNLAGYGADTIDPQSQLAYNQWLQQQQQKQQGIGNTVNLISKFIP